MPPTLRSHTRETVAFSSAPATKAVANGLEPVPPPKHRQSAKRRAKRSDMPDEPPIFTIDLSLPPEQRYLEVCDAFKDELADLTDLFDEVVGEVSGWLLLNWIHWLCRIVLRGVYSREENRELQGISKATGVAMYLLVCFNTLLDLFMGCSSGGAAVEEDCQPKMLHFRTLDWGMDPLRKVVVQLNFKLSQDGPVIASSVTYAGFVGVLTGVRRDFSESLNFRANRHDRGNVIADVKYYWHLLMVLLGQRPSIASVLRGFLLPCHDRSGVEMPLKGYEEIVQTTNGTGPRSGPLTSTACYLCFSDGRQTTVIEKDRVTAISRSSGTFIVVTNADLALEDEATSEEEKTEVSPFEAALQAIVSESKDRRECIEHNWERMCAAKPTRKGTQRGLKPKESRVMIDDVVELAQRFPTTNEMTHFACVMDAREGRIRWCRRWERPVGSRWIREHQSESW